jgi:hypothetical protein
VLHVVRRYRSRDKPRTSVEGEPRELQNREEHLELSLTRRCGEEQAIPLACHGHDEIRREFISSGVALHDLRVDCPFIVLLGQVRRAVELDPRGYGFRLIMRWP